MRPIIILGASGQLGQCLQDELTKEGAALSALSSQDCDITDIDSVKKALGSAAPSIVINCGAYTAVDKAEDDAERAEQVNSLGPRNLALSCRDLNHQLIHVSTDYVFDGTASQPYGDKHPTSPLGVYGKTKLAGELAVLDTLSSSIVIRTSWVFSEYGNNFVKTMLRLGQDRKELSVVADQKGKPTYARDLARAIVTIAKDWEADQSGIYHFSNEGETNWCDFARTIFKEGQTLGLLDHEMQVNAIGSADYPTRAERPKYSVLDNSRIYNDFSVQATGWQDSLREMLGNLQA